MKIILSAVSVAMLCCCMSCNNDAKTGAANDAAQKNLAAMKGVNEAIKSNNMSKLGDFIAADAVDHAGMMGDVKGLDSIKSELSKMGATSKDMNFEVIKEIADSEYVFQWCRFTGTNVIAQMGMAAGSKYNMTAVEVGKFKDGKAVEHWEFMEPAEMMKMMPPPPPMPKKMVDTVMKTK
ncbi:MAG: ester cyclase [Ferruginibacter sp.]